MVPFAGWNMPVRYTEGIIAEHNHTRSKASVFDICHMGEIRVVGDDAPKALDNIFPRPPSKQKKGDCKYNFLLTDRGTVIDDLIIYRIDDYEFLIVVNASSKDADFARLAELLPDSVTLRDESDATAKIDLQGPESANVLEKLGIERSDMPGYYKWTNANIAGTDIILSRTGYTGELGFEIYSPAEKATGIWQAITAFETVKPAGLGARDTLRLEMGYPLYGHELDTDTTPVEAGFGKMLQLDDDREFPGVEILRSRRKRKTLVGIALEGRRAAREGAEIFIDGEKAGTITSGAFSPSLGKAVALAYIQAPDAPQVGTEVETRDGRAQIPGAISHTPFAKNTSLRKTI
jgi:aminomethyltransferase